MLPITPPLFKALLPLCFPSLPPVGMGHVCPLPPRAASASPRHCCFVSPSVVPEHLARGPSFLLGQSLPFTFVALPSLLVLFLPLPGDVRVPQAGPGSSLTHVLSAEVPLPPAAQSSSVSTAQASIFLCECAPSFPLHTRLGSSGEHQPLCSSALRLREWKLPTQCPH